MSRHLLIPAILLCACQPWVAPIGPAPTPEPTPTPEVIEPGLWTPALSGFVLRNPDGGWVASNAEFSWSELQSRAGGGEPFRIASVIETHLSVRDWLAPGDGSDVAAVATGAAADRVQEALDRRRYVALGIYADSIEDLPSGWPTTDVPFDPADVSQLLPDGLIATIDLGDRIAPNYADPDYRLQMSSVIDALGDRFGGEEGVAYVHVSGVGDRGLFEFADPEPWFGGATPQFTDSNWLGVHTLLGGTWEGKFPNSQAFLSWRSIELGFHQEKARNALANGAFQLRDGCMGLCPEPDFDRFPGGAGTPYPDADPYGGWLPGELSDAKVLLGAGGEGGFAAWRLADAEGSWDAGEYGPVDDYLGLVLDAGLEHGNLRFAHLGEDACGSEWIIAASPPSIPCGTNTAGDVWAPLAEFSHRLGSRFAVTEVRSEREELFGTGWRGEVDITNLADLPSDRDHDIEVGFIDLSNREPLDTVTVVLETSQWVPGATTTLPVELPFTLLDAANPAEFGLYVRVLDERAFGGALEIAHDNRDDDGRHVLVTWSAE